MNKLFFIYLLFAGVQTYACDCIIHADPKSYLSMVDMVFTGKVVELIKADTEDIRTSNFLDSITGGKERRKEIYPDNYYARVIMIENIKQKDIKTDTLFFVSGFTNCDPVYQLDKSYLFFADKNENGTFMMVHCTPWGTLKETKQTIEKLKR